MTSRTRFILILVASLLLAVTVMWLDSLPARAQEECPGTRNRHGTCIYRGQPWWYEDVHCHVFSLTRDECKWVYWYDLNPAKPGGASLASQPGIHIPGNELTAGHWGPVRVFSLTHDILQVWLIEGNEGRPPPLIIDRNVNGVRRVSHLDGRPVTIAVRNRAVRIAAWWPDGKHYRVSISAENRVAVEPH